MSSNDEEDVETRDTLRLSEALTQLMHDYLTCYGDRLTFESREQAETFFLLRKEQSVLLLASFLGRAAHALIHIEGREYDGGVEALLSRLLSMMEVGVRNSERPQFRHTTELAFYLPEGENIVIPPDPSNVVRPAAWNTDDDGEE